LAERPKGVEKVRKHSYEGLPVFPSFRDAIIFVNRVASLADDLDHHPDIDIRYKTVSLALTTHSTNGLTEKDVKLAESVDFATSAA